MDTFEDFAHRYRQKLSRDKCHDPRIAGRFGHISPLSDTSDSPFGIVLESGQGVTERQLAARIRRATELGFQLRQAGDWEAIFSFDPSNPALCKAALKLIGAKRRRHLKIHPNSLA